VVTLPQADQRACELERADHLRLDHARLLYRPHHLPGPARISDNTLHESALSWSFLLMAAVLS
jgi:hypothetical protein